MNLSLNLLVTSYMQSSSRRLYTHKIYTLVEHFFSFHYMVHDIFDCVIDCMIPLMISLSLCVYKSLWYFGMFDRNVSKPILDKKHVCVQTTLAFVSICKLGRMRWPPQTNFIPISNNEVTYNPLLLVYHTQ